MNLNETLEGILYMNIGRFPYFRPREQNAHFSYTSLESTKYSFEVSLPSSQYFIRREKCIYSSAGSDNPVKKTQIYPGKVSKKTECPSEDIIIKQQHVESND